MEPQPDNTDRAAMQFMALDMLAQILQHAENPAWLAQYLTDQVRELIGGKIVALLECPTPPTGVQPRLVSVCPAYQRQRLDAVQLAALALASRDLTEAAIWDVDTGPAAASAVLRETGWATALVVPLHTGRTRFGTLLILQLLDVSYVQDTLRTLTTCSNVIALILRNSLLYENLEQTIAKRTAELSAQEHLFRTLTETSPAGILRTDHAGRILYVNRRWCELAGLTLAQVQFQPWTDLVHPEDQPGICQQWQAACQTARPLALEYRLPLTGVWVIAELAVEYHLDGTPFGFIGTITDITARKKTEEQLQYQAFVLQNVSDAIIVTDVNYVIQGWNAAAADIYGWRADEAVGHTINELLQPTYSEQQRAELIAAFWTQGYLCGEVQQHRKDGSLVEISGRLKLLRDQTGRPLGIVITNRDITERKQREQEIRQLNADLEQRVQQRTAELEASNRALQSFAYIVSHDLKAPLRGIAQLTHWLEQDYAAQFDAQGREYLTLLNNRVKRMENLIRGILEYSRVGRPNASLEQVELQQVLLDVLDNLAPPAQVAIRIINALPVVSADKIQMAQVFQNLLGNALKFLDKPQGQIEIGCRRTGAQWTFWVQDNGPGIDPKYHAKIFQLFQTLQTRDEYASSGIGLAIVEKIITFYGGTIWVESTPGQGATFFFTLPQANVPQTSASAANADVRGTVK